MGMCSDEGDTEFVGDLLRPETPCECLENFKLCGSSKTHYFSTASAFLGFHLKAALILGGAESLRGIIDVCAQGNKLTSDQPDTCIQGNVHQLAIAGLLFDVLRGVNMPDVVVTIEVERCNR